MPSVSGNDVIELIPTTVEVKAVRLHLDPCGEADGVLRLIPAGHRYGRIAPAATSRFHATTRS